MSFRAEISRANPSCFLFLIDQSASMRDPFGSDTTRGKAEVVADAVNRIIQNLVLKCAKGRGEVRDYYYVGVLGYGDHVRSVYGAPVEALAVPSSDDAGSVMVGRPVEGFELLVPLSQVANHPLRIEERGKLEDDGAGGVINQTTKFPVWFDPVALGATPMCEVIELAWNVVRDFLTRYPRCYPPIVINITDGESTDGDPELHAPRIQDLASTDGSAVLCNLHLSSRPEAAILFPSSEVGLPDEFAQMLFRLSSVMPEPMVRAAAREGFAVDAASRGFVFNGDMVALVRFLDIGTRVDPKNLR